MTLSGEISGIPTSPSAELRKRAVAGANGVAKKSRTVAMDGQDSARLPEGAVAHSSSDTEPLSWTARNRWIVFAVASGACAAFNGVFAKLTTNDLTTDLARGISRVLGLKTSEGIIEILVRCVFFGLNLALNGVMWTLFTQALARGHSATQVSIMNTSTNFMITALLGLLIFAESLPSLWWLGAAMLVAGNVIIGRKDEGTKDDDKSADDGPLVGSTAHGDSGRQRYGSIPETERSPTRRGHGE
ncbi:hypothetical protein DL766_006864 [Monosporascus sp. MC13-8B]|uniref:EamA domain-containing protein n=1 Tax=Monosporascus cannonballus TaxID=155416 RepID=A0ABY0H174_9PEZI|nr:hypothetical protein DL762_008176 [Monosporascus cannonballus]RYO82697.1 hypothetical protein DL763_008152 [Monosporascus cannonballus]RYP25982.1 hypothetical protein DL766_006864 [Monosporascus sp. MC13-8B]